MRARARARACMCAYECVCAHACVCVLARVRVCCPRLFTPPHLGATPLSCPLSVHSHSLSKATSRSINQSVNAIVAFTNRNKQRRSCRLQRLSGTSRELTSCRETIMHFDTLLFDIHPRRIPVVDALSLASVKIRSVEELETPKLRPGAKPKTSHHPSSEGQKSTERGSEIFLERTRKGHRQSG